MLGGKLVPCLAVGVQCAVASPPPTPAGAPGAFLDAMSVDSRCAGEGRGEKRRGSPLFKKMTQTIHRSHSFPAGFQEFHSNINGLSY